MLQYLRRRNRSRRMHVLAVHVWGLTLRNERLKRSRTPYDWSGYPGLDPGPRLAAVRMVSYRRKINRDWTTLSLLARARA